MSVIGKVAADEGWSLIKRGSTVYLFNFIRGNECEKLRISEL